MTKMLKLALLVVKFNDIQFSSIFCLCFSLSPSAFETNIFSSTKTMHALRDAREGLKIGTYKKIEGDMILVKTGRNFPRFGQQIGGCLLFTLSLCRTRLLRKREL